MIELVPIRYRADRDVAGGVGRSFTNPDIDAPGLAGLAYRESADRRSWAAMLGLFEEALEPR